MSEIADIKCREILDSRGHPTVEAEVILDNGFSASASVPSGASKGSYEAYELRDGDLNRFSGLGVLGALKNIKQKIKPALKGIDITQQETIDQIMLDCDGTSNKRNLGANSLLAVSLASARAAASLLNLPLYQYIQKIFGNVSLPATVTPLFNLINGGMHGSGKLGFQEFLVIPHSSVPFPTALQMGVELYQRLKTFLKAQGLSYSVGDEGGFTPNLETNEQAIELLYQIIKKSKYQYRKDVYLGLDLAASGFFKNNHYQLKEFSHFFTSNEFIAYLEKLHRKYHFFFLEDPLNETDWHQWEKLTQKMGDSTLIVGDDLLVTNKERLEKAIKTSACNSILVKVNQIGTLTETLEVVKRAKEAKFKVIISHRSGETNDDFIADLAVGVKADFVKFGAPARGERVVKYNRLLKVYEELKNNPIIQ